MAESDFCRQCGQAGSCKDAYRRIGQYGGPSVLPKVLLAFVIPLAVFVVVVAAADAVLVRLTDSSQLRVILSMLLGLAAAGSAIIVAKALDRQYRQKG